MTLSAQEEQQLINDLMGHLRITEEWMDAQRPTPLAGSAFAGDDSATHPHRVSHQVSRSITVAVDHLHSMRMALTGSGDGMLGLHTYAPLTLTRVALENAATAVWIASPAQRDERILRRLRLEMASVKAVQSFLAELDEDPLDPTREAARQRRADDAQRRKDKVHALGAARTLSRTAIGQKPTPTEIVKDAGETAGLVVGGRNLAFPLWRFCSAVAHGDAWVLPQFDVEVLEEFSPAGVGTVRITAPTELVRAGVQAAIMVVHTARELYTQRSGL